MKIKPVLNSVKPKYPDKYEIELNKALLYYRPHRWLQKPLVGLSLTALLAAGLTSGCIHWNNAIPVGEPPPPDFFFVSDNDALKIIAEELEKAGYSINIPGRNNGGFEFDAQIKKNTDIRDLEYVSVKDCRYDKYPVIIDSNNNLPKDAAKKLKTIYKDAAIFYDPRAEQEQESKEIIRFQILDFIEWLQSIE